MRDKLESDFTAAVKALYHNATPEYPLADDPKDFDSWFTWECEFAFDDLRHEFKDLGKIYQYGRGGRTVAPENFVQNTGGGSFRLRCDPLDLENDDLAALTARLEEFNAWVRDWNASIADEYNAYRADLDTDKTASYTALVASD